MENHAIVNQRKSPVTGTSFRPALTDHLCVDPRSPHHIAAGLEHDIGMRVNGKTLDRKGPPLLIKLKGHVEAFYR